MPLPVPDAPLTTVSHGSFAVAVHAHEAADAVTDTDPEPPVSEKIWPAGAIENVQGGAGAACVTVKVWPPIVSVPARAAPVFAATLKLTVPLPVPDAPPVTVSHPALALAVHVQLPAEAVTATDPEPPASPMF
ncbi:MAG: hypothetical protein JWL71_4805 [Acidobacteria bacterium]|nr:hypothetical protein [Acidobacteriota bacterium]